MDAHEPAIDSLTRTLVVDRDNDGVRLDAYLASQIEGWSRARLQHLIADEEVLVNGKPAKSSYKLNANDAIEVELGASPTTSFVPENIPLDIVFEDEALIVVNKPAGLVVHPAAGIQTGTLANALAYHFEKLSTNAGAVRPGIVHRIDKDTSGLLAVAKTEIAHEHLAEQFRERKVFKSYLALVHGVVERDTGRIEEPLARDPRNRTRMAIVRGGRGALSLYNVRRRFERFTLLEVEIKTGRTHQIRVHVASLKHPVVGDEVYGGGRDNTVRDSKVRVEIRKLGRHFLHAAELGLRHPISDEQLRFQAPLPADLQQLLDVLER
jgi:23S rRNA pseudouridine1911/1915/1917 synthase